MRQIFRRSTSPVGMSAPSTTSSSPIGFGVPNRVEKLKKGPGYKFRERDRVKVIAPPQFANRTGYIVPTNDVQNEQGLMEIELDHVLPETHTDFATNYTTLTDEDSKTNLRQRLTIRAPVKQLIPFKYMKCQSQHFVISLRADSLLQISLICTTLLGADLLCLLFAISNGGSDWNNNALLITFLLLNCSSIGAGFYCVLVTAFIGYNMKKMAVLNNLPQLGNVRDECVSYHWFKSTHWKPWWLCGKEIGVIEFCVLFVGKMMVMFVLLFMVSVVFYIADHCEWYIMVVCIMLVTVPSMFVVHLIKNRELMQFV